MTSPTITPDLIARAAQAGACREALAWLREQPRTLDELIVEHRDWAAWAALCLVSAEAWRVYAAATADALRAYWAAEYKALRAFCAARAEALRACLLTLWED